MITRQLASEMEQLWNQAQQPSLSAVRRLECLEQLGILHLRMLEQLIDAGDRLWNRSGVGAAIMAGTDGKVIGDGQYDVAYHKILQILLLSFRDSFLSAAPTAEVGGQHVTLPLQATTIINMDPMLGSATAQPEEII